MAIEIKVPTLGESVTEATVGKWFKKAGDAVKIDEPLCELETDKVTVEVPAPAAGVLAEIAVERRHHGRRRLACSARSRKALPRRQPRRRRPPPPLQLLPSAAGCRCPPPRPMPPAPAARKILEEKGIAAADVAGSGKRGQVLKEDAVAATAKPRRGRAVAARGRLRADGAGAGSGRRRCARRRPPTMPPARSGCKMTRLRQTIARRLKDAQNTAAMLTTFNDVDMSAVMALRNQYKDLFEKRHGVKLGFMGFFVKACLQALKEIPAVNAEIDGTDIVYKNYYHIGVAVGTDKGLVVPVVREADRMSLAEIEATIADFGRRARDGKLGIEEMQGGTFTISNGGVYGSMMSTPILNAPQSGILGMHRIEERPVVRNGQIVIRPMMYLALSYDHRIVDGKEAVTFLVRVKECLEDPQRFVLEL